MPTFQTGCLLCGEDLVYAVDSRPEICRLCGTSAVASVSCSKGHFVCDACHGAGAADVIERMLGASDSCDPIALCTEVMRSPAVHMHGPEHHFLVPAALLVAYDTLKGTPELKGKHLRAARERAAKVPGGFCGTHGNCGAAVGAGIFRSIVTGATPLSRDAWQQSNMVTARSLLKIAVHGGPRCCKRDSYLAIIESMRYVKELEELDWTIHQPVCGHSDRNKQCLGTECPFHPSSSVPGVPACG